MASAAPPVPVVLDASITVGMATGEEPAINAVLAAARGGGMLIAPAHVWIETANALPRGRRHSPLDVVQVLEDMARMGIETADRGLEGLRAAIGLTERHRLSVHDAAYLWLAIDVDGELATLDQQLARAVAAEGVALVIQP